MSSSPLLLAARNPSLFILSANQENTFGKEDSLRSGCRDFFGGVSSPSAPRTAPLPAEDSSESGNSPGAQEFQPLEHFLPRGTVVGFDYEESVRGQGIF